ncbi:5'-phosphate synthase pdxT subunit [Halanaerobium saccharolyticum]|uniref:Pyridoxal 5'-phosphate synthase subunit PdxT n=1 Tax=Halanaerobium saccharolyticum TaxID=43595 RepID=A0A4R6M283_9FIRM|nr:pyridoxal 5'-phosphate synthase glutaminase subunit PdxT [Halanaerobium saccharolyticum]TDO94665.1 5'-phosphate synthase pdxT subunit [Halanaerobium saccharolyticum]
MKIKVGVLALQGGVAEHLDHLNQIENVQALAVKKPEELNSCAGLIIPGGESTTIRKLIKAYNFKKAIRKFYQQQKVIWGSCAGLILLAAEVEGEKEEQLGLLDIKVKRNAFGSQLNSFIEKAVIPKISDSIQELVFIRAPLITEVGRGIEILYQKEGQIAAVESKNLIGTSFHPELTDSNAFHQYFVSKIRNKIS